MKTTIRFADLPLLVWAASLAIGVTFALGSAQPHDGPPIAGWIVTAENRRITGTLTGTIADGFRFVPNDGAPIPLERLTVVQFEPSDFPADRGLPGFQVVLGRDQRLSGQLVSVDGEKIQLLDAVGDRPITIRRSGTREVRQRPGEVLVFRDDFETLDESRWTRDGAVAVAAIPQGTGQNRLRLPAAGGSIRHRLSEPIAAGRLELVYQSDSAGRSGEPRWWLELVFQNMAGEFAPVRVILGWSPDGPAVETPLGPTLAIQRLTLEPGRHIFSLRFDGERLEAAVDSYSLARGNGPAGPLVELRLAAESREPQTAGDLVAAIDSLAVMRSVASVGGLEVDPGQDEVRLTGGDQWFGEVLRADLQDIVLRMDGHDLSVNWTNAVALRFRREPIPGNRLEGLLVRADWRVGPGRDASAFDLIEGCLRAIGPDGLRIVTPFAGELTVPCAQLRRLTVLGWTRRYVLDATPHHLGDQTIPTLDPPQAEGGVWELDFSLDAPAIPGARLTFDVVEVAGEADNLAYSDFIKNKELRTNVYVNNQYVDYLNRHIFDLNETPTRVTISVPEGLLRSGANRLRLEQTGKLTDPTYLDDLGILEVGLEFPAGRGVGP